MASESHSGGEEFKDNCEIDKVDHFPYGGRDPLRDRGRRGGTLREGEFNLLFGEGES